MSRAVRGRASSADTRTHRREIAMLSRSLTNLAHRRGVIGAAAMLGLSGTFALGLATNASAAATPTVTVTVTQAGGYTGTFCVGDNLEARCVDNVRKGQSRSFSVHPGKGEPVTVSVIANGGGSAFAQLVPSGSALKLAAAGSRAEPAIERR